MPLYQGGKSRIGKKIHDVILIVEDDLIGEEDDNLPYFEPFVGMGGVMRYFGKDNDRELYASDASTDMVMMWQALQKGWEPPTKCSEECYNRLKHAKPSADRAFIGTVAAWGGIWFHAFRLKYAPKNRNYLMEGYRGILKMKPAMENVNFLSARSYEKFKPKGMLIYCDPPYIGNLLGDKKSKFQNFNHPKFWNVMRKWSKDNIVIISEWEAPKDFKKIWSTKSSVVSSPGRKNKKYSDNLYVYKTIYEQLSPDAKKEIAEI